MIFTFSRVIDLSHPIAPTMPNWPGDPQTEITPVRSVAGDGYSLNRLTLGEHSGTHIGAPRHFVQSGQSVDQIPAVNLIAPGSLIDITQATANDRDYLLSREDIGAWEKRHGRLQANSLVLVRTGWSVYWNNSTAYLGAAQNSLHFPGVSPAAARFLSHERKIIGLGIDTAGIDGGLSADFAANVSLAEAGIYHLENLKMEELPETDFVLFVGALAVKNGSGSPCRVLAICHNLE